MKRSYSLLFAIFVLVLTTAAGTLRAQSTDRDHPTPLQSNEVTGDVIESNAEHFYSFTAGPGELTVTLDVKASSDKITGLSFELLERNSATVIEGGGIAHAANRESDRIVRSVKLTRRQTVILHTINSSGDNDGTFRVRLTGSAVSGGNFSTGGGYNDDYGRSNNNNDQELRNRGGADQLEVPASGTLHIRMKNGTTQDINLNRVRSISVGP